MRPHGKARVNPNNPQAFACCDRCQQWRNRVDLRYQYDYRGRALSNLHLLVCETCYDNPQPQLKPRVIPPDPIPIRDPRPERYVSAGALVAGSVGAADGAASLEGAGNILFGAAAAAAGEAMVEAFTASSGVAAGASSANAETRAVKISEGFAVGDSFVNGRSDNSLLGDGAIGSQAISEGPISGAAPIN